MHVHFGLDLLRADWPESCLCIGTFDGVHLGHQAVINRAVAIARSSGLPSVLVTFDRHPAAILAPERCPPSIAPLQTNLQHFEELGIAVAVVLRFDHELSETSAEGFLTNTLQKGLKAHSIVIGHDFAFGKDRRGTPDWLTAHIPTEVVPAFEIGGVRVSSSAVRRSVEGGNMEETARLLGRNFEIPGIVVSGQKLGRTLGYPTVNLARSFRQVLPSDGVYAGECDTPQGTFAAAISIGLRPTIDDTRTIEAFLLEYPGDEIYGAAIKLRVARKLRDQIRFESLEDLKLQMASDVREVLRVI